ncbi:MAG: hypothetical protein ACOC2W_01720 [bacterium]
MVDMRYKPYHLPQISAPYSIVLQKLDGDGVGYDLIDANPEDLNTSQGVVFSDKVADMGLDDTNPIWVAGDDKVIDGHHRWVKALHSSKPIKAVKIHMNDKDACRLLNKIQDIYEYEENQKNENVDEVVVQDVINQHNEIDNYFDSLEEENENVKDDNYAGNNKTIVAYRKEPIKENSVVGNFFTLKPIDGFDKYEIDFENLLDTNELGLSYMQSQNPVDILAKTWFPHINFEKISQMHGISPDNLKAKVIAFKANKLGYDGVKYGDSIIQGLK